MRIHLVALLFAALAAVPASAQAPSAPRPSDQFQFLLDRLIDDEVVWVTDGSGTTVKGRVLSHRAGVLTVAIRNASRVFAERDVTRVQRLVADPKWNGILIGALVGLSTNLIICSPRYESGESCRDNISDIVIGTASAAALGLWIDRLKKSRRTIYTAPSPASLRLSPTVSPRGAGVLVTARF